MQKMDKEASKICAAINIALTALTGYTDEKKNPLIIHALEVMDLVENELNQKIIAILHDVPNINPGFPIEYFINIQIDEDLLESLKAMTRFPNEKYMDYIKRLRKDEVARKVKIKELEILALNIGFSDITSWELSVLTDYKKAMDLLNYR